MANEKETQLTAGEEQLGALLTELKKSNELLSKNVHTASSWKIALRNGLMFGIGSGIGASLLVWLVLSLLKPLEHIQFIRGPVQQLSTELQRPKK